MTETTTVPAIITPDRQFKMGSVILDDPAPDESPEKALSYYAAAYPHLRTAILSLPTTSSDGTTVIYEVLKPEVNTKG